MANIYQKYFPDLDENRLRLLHDFKSISLEWNEKINVISRKDTDSFEVNHVLHSLSIAKEFQFKSNAHILDFGSGGGFPGLLLAIFFPNVHFTLVDSIAKKMKVVQACSDALELKNVTVITDRVENLHDKFDFITCRAVGRLSKIIPWVKGSLSTRNQHSFPNGFIFLKGGDLEEEISEIRMPYKRIPISNIYDEPFLKRKKSFICPSI